MATNQDNGTNQDMNRNPTGKGGFGDNPGNRNPGGWKKEDSIGYQYNKLIRMNEADFKKWLEENPENERTVAQALAYSAVINAKNKLDYLKEVTDRSEGKALQKVEMEGNLSVQISKLESIIDDLITEDTEDPEIN
jgi:hypothetical protein